MNAPFDLLKTAPTLLGGGQARSAVGPDGQDDLEAAWAAEIGRRVAEVASGAVAAIPLAQATEHVRC